VSRVNGPVVEIIGLHEVSAYDLVRVGPHGLVGEVVSLRDGVATAQVYEYTGGLAPGDSAVCDHFPLAARLGPGLLGGVFDGTLRRLDAAPLWLDPATRMADGSESVWTFTPADGLEGNHVRGGAILGTVREGSLEHRVQVPPGIEGVVTGMADTGSYGTAERVALVGEREVGMVHRWPVRTPRPVAERIEQSVQLITGQRVIDLLYPVAMGSTAAVPGGFGTGKTLLLQQIAKWCNADVIVYVGCGERGNEMTDVLHEFSALRDPRSGARLMERTVIIANTSNMPVMAREASIYTGMTVAEYFRDMGYDVVLIADSTSRWAEALREFASRTGQMPAEEGYPAGLASALAAFYERAGRVRTLGGAVGSVTIVAAVSPPGADMTEPVTSQTRRFVRCVWSLDRDLAYARQYPAVSWRESFSRDAEEVGSQHVIEGDADWLGRRARALALLAEADRIEPLVELVGLTALPDRQRVTRRAAQLLRDAVLRQSALSENDAFCAREKQNALLESVLDVIDRLFQLGDAGMPASRIEELDLSVITGVAASAGPGDADAVLGAGATVFASLEGTA
jgi:V/A-type H+/Na+-transporting ATPase subunit A